MLTVEDPIEYSLPGIGQTQVNNKADMTFARGLRAILRQDPDVVMVGEIRDLETAEIAVQASLTGHFGNVHITHEYRGRGRDPLDRYGGRTLSFKFQSYWCVGAAVGSSFVPRMPRA